MLIVLILLIPLPGGYLLVVAAEALVAVLLAAGASLGWGAWWLLLGEEGLVLGHPLEVVVAVLAADGDVLVHWSTGSCPLGEVVLALGLACGAVLGVPEPHLVIPVLFAGGEFPLQVAAVVPAYQFQGGACVEVVGSDGGVVCLAHVVLYLLVVVINPLSIIRMSFLSAP